MNSISVFGCRTISASLPVAAHEATRGTGRKGMVMSCDTTYNHEQRLTAASSLSAGNRAKALLFQRSGDGTGADDYEVTSCKALADSPAIRFQVAEEAGSIYLAPGASTAERHTRRLAHSRPRLSCLLGRALPAGPTSRLLRGALLPTTQYAHHRAGGASRDRLPALSEDLILGSSFAPGVPIL